MVFFNRRAYAVVGTKLFSRYEILSSMYVVYVELVLRNIVSFREVSGSIWNLSRTSQNPHF